MTITKIGVRGVIDEREEKGNECERDYVGIATEKENDDGKKGAESQASVEEEDGTEEESISGKEIAQGSFGAEPGGDDAARDKLSFESGMCANELPGEAALFVHISSFAELSVETRFAKASDTLDAADSVLIEDVVIAKPEFEGKIRTERDEAVELDVVADGPRSATD